MFGVLLRVRRIPERGDEDQRVEGVLEWPDFHSKVYVTGEVDYDAETLTLSEESVISGNNYHGWITKYGDPAWRPGTTFTFQLDNDTSSLSGAVDWTGVVGGKEVEVAAAVVLRTNHLFNFDRRFCASSLQVSQDQHSVTCRSAESVPS